MSYYGVKCSVSSSQGLEKLSSRWLKSGELKESSKHGQSRSGVENKPKRQDCKVGKTNIEKEKKRERESSECGKQFR